jgi:hypothetical protein
VRRLFDRSGERRRKKASPPESGERGAITKAQPKGLR